MERSSRHFPSPALPPAVLALPRATLAPYAAAVRARLGADEARAGVEVLFGVWELAREQQEGRTGGTGWIQGAAGRLATLTGLGSRELQAGRAALEGSGLLVAEGGEDRAERFRISADVLCDYPVLARLDTRALLPRLQREGSVPPALAVLREVARRMETDAPEAVQVSVAELAAETLYGESAVKHALSRLERADLVGRTMAGRHMRLELRPGALGEAASPAPLPAPSPPGPAAPTASGVVVEIAGVQIPVRPEDRFSPPPGHVLGGTEVLPDGRVLLRYLPG